MTNANQVKTEAVLVKEGKNEFLYLKNVPVFFAKILELGKKYQSEDLEYQMTVFVDTETREKLELPVDEDGIALNKELKEVGKDRNKLKKIKYPLQSQLKEGENTSYDTVDGLHGMSLSLNELTKKGNKSILKVVDSDGKDWDKSKAIGNGSILHVKCFGYRNQDEQLVVFPNLVVVVDHVPYEGNTGGIVQDDVLGVSFDMSSSYANDEDDKATPESIMDAANNSPTEDFNDENPFF
ncbi:Single-stranded DNA-binding protein [Psychrobacter phage D'Alembert]|nr:Single-stranded DNA-binding protein [Psychrobacter phage D'Alembert]